MGWYVPLPKSLRKEPSLEFVGDWEKLTRSAEQNELLIMVYATGSPVDQDVGPAANRLLQG